MVLNSIRGELPLSIKGCLAPNLFQLSAGKDQAKASDLGSNPTHQHVRELSAARLSVVAFVVKMATHTDTRLSTAEPDRCRTYIS